MARRKGTNRTVLAMSSLTVGVFLLTTFVPGDHVWALLAPVAGGALFELLRDL